MVFRWRGFDLVWRGIVLGRRLERVALTCSQYCTVSLQFFAEKRLHILRNCSNGSSLRNERKFLDNWACKLDSRKGAKAQRTRKSILISPHARPAR